MTAGYANVSKPSLAQDFCAHAGIFEVKMPRAMKVASAKAVKAEEAAKPVRKRKKTKPSDPDQEQESDEDKQVSGLPQSAQSILKASRGNSAAEKKAASAAEKKVAPEVPPDSAPKKPPEARAKRKRIPPKAQILIKKEPVDSSERQCSRWEKSWCSEERLLQNHSREARGCPGSTTGRKRKIASSDAPRGNRCDEDKGR